MIDSELATHILFARLFAMKVHAGQFRRDGVTPYLTHCEAVANAVEPRLQPIAWMHDCLEEGPMPATLLSFMHQGFPLWITNAVLTLTKRTGEAYEDYLQRVKEDPDARAVKFADMLHNLSCNPTDQQREKYARAFQLLAVETVE